jgi:hypothetical protein
MRAPLLGALLLLAGCAAGPAWQSDLTEALSASRQREQDLVVFFALRGRELSDRMERSLGDPEIVAALAAGDFAAVVGDGVERARLWAEWAGYGEGMGIAVLDGKGRAYAARPGPQDPAELAAFLRLCASHREAIASYRDRVPAAIEPVDQHALGCLLLQLGCRRDAELLLLDAAMAGVADARHRLARLYALGGDVTRARQWLAAAPKTGPAQVTEGYVLFKERRHADAARVLEAALRGDLRGDLGDDRQRALLYLGKALHENKEDDRALPLLEALAREATGSTFEAAARHTLSHIRDPQHGHDH